jgi:hypothetical protein
VASLARKRMAATAFFRDGQGRRVASCLDAIAAGAVAALEDGSPVT